MYLLCVLNGGALDLKYPKIRQAGVCWLRSVFGIYGGAIKPQLTGCREKGSFADEPGSIHPSIHPSTRCCQISSFQETIHQGVNVQCVITDPKS